MKGSKAKKFDPTIGTYATIGNLEDVATPTRVSEGWCPRGGHPAALSQARFL